MCGKFFSNSSHIFFQTQTLDILTYKPIFNHSLISDEKKYENKKNEEGDEGNKQ